MINKQKTNNKVNSNLQNVTTKHTDGLILDFYFYFFLSYKMKKKIKILTYI